MAVQNFTDEEKKATAQLAQLVQRQIGMGVPPDMAVGVVAAALGALCHEQKWPKEQLSQLLPVIEKGFEGAVAGVAARVGGGKK